MRISEGTLLANARALRARVPETVKMLCVVKADAYGHGALRLSRTLHGLADAFAVATAEEAREIRAIQETLRAHGALGAVMTGSGPTVFGLFAEQTQAEEAAAALKRPDRQVFTVQPV